MRFLHVLGNTDLKSTKETVFIKVPKSKPLGSNQFWNATANASVKVEDEKISI